MPDEQKIDVSKLTPVEQAKHFEALKQSIRDRTATDHAKYVKQAVERMAPKPADGGK